MGSDSVGSLKLLMTCRSFDLVIFDMDGTLVDTPIDFAGIRKRLGIPPQKGILEYIDSLEKADRKEKMSELGRLELEAAARSRLSADSVEIIAELFRRGIACALLTRNSRRSMQCVLNRFTELRFHCTKSRDDFPPKPHPDSVRNICTELGIAPERTLVVGDYYYDIHSAKQAGAYAALLCRDSAAPEYAAYADWIISELQEIRSILSGAVFAGDPE